MELGTTYIVLSYIGPICGIVGFIITPGMTHIRPWLMEKFSKDKRQKVIETLSKDYSEITTRNLAWYELELFNKNHRFDWRPKISRKRRELKNQIKNVR